VGNPVMTSGTEMEWDVNETFWTFKDKFHILDSPIDRIVALGLKIPNHKLQIPNKLQAPISNDQIVFV
jgi:hypothetical protein